MRETTLCLMEADRPSRQPSASFATGRLAGLGARQSPGYLRFLIGQAFVLMLLPGAASAVFCQDAVLFEDPFDGDLGPGWTWVRERAAHWSVREGALEIRVVPGKAATVENALVRGAPDRSGTPYAVEVTVTALQAPIQQYEQAGITLYKDGQPFFKLVKEFVDGKRLIVPGFVPAEPAKVRLRVEVTADAYRAGVDTTGTGAFVTISEGPLPPPGSEQISLQGYDGPPDAEHWFRFDDFRIVALEPVGH